MCKCNCIIDAIISLAVGIVIGLIYSTGIITGITTAIWIIFGITILTLIISLINKKCTCINGSCTAIATIGSIILSIIALSITLGTSLIYAIIIGVLGFFASFVIISLYRIITCITKESCKC